MGGQKDAGADHIFRVAPASRRGLGGDELVEGVTAASGLDLTQRGGLGGGDVAGAHAVALDVVLAVLGGDVLGQHLEGALCGGVGGDGLAAQLAHHGADVDDLALVLFHHIRQDSLEQLNAPPTWTSMTRMKSAWLISTIGTRFIRPALLTRMSTGPTSA